VNERHARTGLRGSLLLVAAGVLGRLPERPLVAGAEALGELWYRIAPPKRVQARANLRRVCEGLAASGTGSAFARRAATDPEALERLVRRAFQHAARYYLEVARTGGLDPETAAARMDFDTAHTVAAAVAGGKPIIMVGLHFGAIEMPVLFMSRRLGHRFTAPMETVADPGLQRWFVESRSRVGVNIVQLAGARRTLLAALRRGESIGLISDRDLQDAGLPTPFFGHPAPIPVGPALLALETGAPVYVAAARRMKGGRYRARMIHVPFPDAATGTRRERLTVFTEAMVAAFETILADAPEQWWGAFHPIWRDLAADRGEPAERAEAAP